MFFQILDESLSNIVTKIKNQPNKHCNMLNELLKKKKPPQNLILCYKDFKGLSTMCIIIILSVSVNYTM